METYKIENISQKIDMINEDEIDEDEIDEDKINEYMTNKEIYESKKLDDDWIHNFEKTDKLYQDFYKDDIHYTNLHFVYTNKDCEIEKINHESFLMSVPNYITREEILGILKRKSIENNIRYTLLSILKYNITLDAGDIRNFLVNSDIYSNFTDFLIPIKHIDAIKFERTINMFQDLNDLVFIFYEKIKNVTVNPNYIFSQLNSNTYANKSNLTKKVFLNSNTHKKTIRKQFKD